MRRYLGQPPSAEPLPEAELLQGVLAGMAPRTRRKQARRWLAQGRALPEELCREAEGPGGVAAAAARGIGGQGEVAPAERPSSSVDVEEAGEGGAGEAAAASGGALAGAAGAQASSGGHAWHGQELVQAVAREAGEPGLSRLCQRFRQAFVDAVRPQVSLLGASFMMGA